MGWLCRSRKLSGAIHTPVISTCSEVSESRLKLEVRRQKVKSARNRAAPYVRLLLVTRLKKYDTLAG